MQVKIISRQPFNRPYQAYDIPTRTCIPTTKPLSHPLLYQNGSSSTSSEKNCGCFRFSSSRKKGRMHVKSGFFLVLGEHFLTGCPWHRWGRLPRIGQKQAQRGKSYPWSNRSNHLSPAACPPFTQHFCCYCVCMPVPQGGRRGGRKEPPLTCYGSSFLSRRLLVRHRCSSTAPALPWRVPTACPFRICACEAVRATWVWNWTPPAAVVDWTLFFSPSPSLPPFLLFLPFSLFFVSPSSLPPHPLSLCSPIDFTIACSTLAHHVENRKRVELRVHCDSEARDCHL